MMEFDRREIEGSLPGRFAAVVRRFPDLAGLRDGTLEWTYGDLDRAANLVARRCRPAPAGAPPVLLMLGHGALEIVALLAVLKGGRAWVALDPASPPARLAAIAADAGADLVLTCRRHARLAAGLAARVEVLPGAATLLAAARDPDLAAAAGQAPAVAIAPDDLASIVYTSGSTGAPKGVMRSHASALHRCWLFQRDHRIAPGERIAHLFGCGFVAAEVDVYGALLNGGTLCCYPVRELGFAGLSGWLARERIALLHPPPALWRQYLAGLERPPALPALRTLCLAGEAVYRRDVERMRALFPACTVEHRLSSSETSVIASIHFPPGAPIADEVLPAGHPVADKEVLLLAPDGRAVAPGEAGEIVVQSRYLAPGYWRQPELTARAFVPLAAGTPPLRRFHTGDLGRFDAAGRLHHLGRLDDRLKVRGYRVDPREVEAALLGLDAVEAAAVVARPGPDGEPALVACLVAGAGPAVSPAELRACLAARLPEYLIPSRFEWWPALPHTASGKVDRVALREAAAGAAPVGGAPPRAGTEARVAALWREILRLDRVGRDDDFFTLGGQSLLAAALVARLNTAFGRALPLAVAYRVPTIAGQAAVLEGDAGSMGQHWPAAY